LAWSREQQEKDEFSGPGTVKMPSSDNSLPAQGGSSNPNPAEV